MCPESTTRPWLVGSPLCGLKTFFSSLDPNATERPWRHEAEGSTRKDEGGSAPPTSWRRRATGPAFVLSASGNNISDTIATLAAGASATIDVSDALSGTLANHSILVNAPAVSAASADPNSSNNSASASTTVINTLQWADLAFNWPQTPRRW